ncbi:ATP-binding protein [Actinomadura rupiterrae]|uniref:ATP-binding protein n=1 Tax=Actinomadura rupiterrae TaxID=559627 RepID=UPI0020A37886|nr:ATP-binding protein [Actinomadura rupiterrae]MCP2341220.1 anti-sigma regulatory factor (Ser/Thr protein kinase) [Actinomadura rupiterrae]
MNTEMTVLASLTLPGHPRSVRYARRFLRDTLVPMYVVDGGDVLDDLTLVVDEFAGNAIRHTASGRGGRLTIALLRGAGVVRVEVTDDGAGGGRPELRPSPEGESGRGLHIVQALCSTWGHRADGERTTVWADIPLTPF